MCALWQDGCVHLRPWLLALCLGVAVLWAALKVANGKERSHHTLGSHGFT